MNQRSSWAMGRGPWACLVVVALSVAASAQQNGKPVFRAGTTLVRLDVRVVDRDGKPITDLRQDEVQVVDGGASRPVVLFQRVSGAAGSYLEAAQRTIASEISTNQGAPQGQLYVLVFDQDHIRSGGEQRVRAAAQEFLRTRVRPQDRVAIYGLPGPGPTQPFTANLSTARLQLDRVHGALDRQGIGPVTEMSLFAAYEICRGNDVVLNRFMSVESAANASNGSSTLMSDFRRSGEEPAVIRQLLRENAQQIVNRADESSRRFLGAFATLLRGFRGIDGRKTVMLFSEGFYGDNVAREIEDVAAAAAETYSVIYAFDLNRRNDAAETAEATSDEPAEIIDRLNSIGSLAADTGGELLKDASGRAGQAMASLLPDDTTYYLLGFEAAPGSTAEAAYRHVDIRSSRPGARVLARTGYARPNQSHINDSRKAIDTALSAPFTQQSLKLEYTTYTGQSLVAGRQRVALSVLAELPVRQDESDVADIVFVVRDSRSGAVAASGSDHLALPSRTETGFSTGQTAWRVAFELPAGDYLMRCVVREPGGVIGSADRRFRVRPIGGPDVNSTDLLFSTPGDPFPVRARGYSASALVGTLRLHGPTTDKLQRVSARLELTPDNADGTVRTGRTIDGVVTDVVIGPQGAARDVLFSMPLEKLAAGAYVARAIVRVDGEVVADMGRPVDVIDGAVPELPPAPTSAGAKGVLNGEIVARLVRHAATLPDPVLKKAAIEAGNGQWSAVLTTTATLPAADAVGQRLRGLALMGRDDYAAAAASLSASFDIRTEADVAFVLGWAQIGAGNRVAAVTAFRNANVLDPLMVPAYLALGETYVALGHPALARQALEAGLAKVPASIELKSMLDRLK